MLLFFYVQNSNSENSGNFSFAVTQHKLVLTKWKSLMINFTSSQKDNILACLSSDNIVLRGAGWTSSESDRQWQLWASHETQWPLPLSFSQSWRWVNLISRPLAPVSQKREEREKRGKWVLKVEQASSLSVSNLPLCSIWHSISTFTALSVAVLPLLRQSSTAG